MPVREKIILVIAGMVMVGQGRTEAQSLVSPRAIALGAYSPFVSDTRDFGMNPAGLSGLRDWEFSSATYLPTSGEVDGWVFQGLAIGKRFLGDHAAAMQFSNGTALEVIFPAQGVIIGPDPTTVDTRLSYSEKLSLGYAFAATADLSVGLGARLRQEKVTDTRYQLMDTVIARLPDLVRQSDQWLFDVSLLWRPDPSLAFAVTGRNILAAGDSEFPAELSEYQLENDPTAAISAAYRVSEAAAISLQGATDGTAAAGTEFRPSPDWALRAGLYMNEDEQPFVYGIGAGAGWTYDFLQFDISYLHFFNRETHSGTLDPGLFDPALIGNIDLNPYSPSRVSLSVTARFGNLYGSRARIDGVAITRQIYPSEGETYSYTPVGSVFVTNTSGQPVHLKASLSVDRVMDAPTVSGPFFARPGQQVEIPLTALFNQRLAETGSTSIRDATIVVSSQPGEQDDVYQARLVIHGRNAWSGSAEALRYFVTPDDPSVLRYTRDVLLAGADSLSTGSGELAQFNRAKILIDTFAGKLLYVGDPKQSADFVQYPSETLDLKGGDCDDMTVCFSSLLNSIGISTAFVDVVPPENPEGAHVYLLFDTGVPADRATLISSNPKRYVVRKGSNGRETVWIPIETTRISEGFNRAWDVGAEEFQNDTEIGLGLIRGWVRIVDVY